MIDIRSSIPLTNYRNGRTSPIDTIVFHHIVGDADSAIARFRKQNEEVSSTYIIGSDGSVYYTVDELNTPYTNGNFNENSRSITIEHAGGGSVEYTGAMYRASINLVREIGKRHNITRFLRHRDISSTACPGNLDVERIINDSKGVNMDLNKAKEAVAFMYLATNTGDRGNGYATVEQVDYWGKRIANDPNTLPELAKALSQHKANELMKYKAFNVDGGYPFWLAKSKEQSKIIDIKDKEISRLNSIVGDAGKWETLRTLLKEFLGIK